MGGAADPTGLPCNSTATLTDFYIRSGVAVGSSVFICRSSAYVLFSGGGGGTPGGSTTQIQFNDSSAFGGDAGLTYDKTTDTLTISGVLKLGTTPVTISDAAGKILSAALNTVGVGQGGTGATTLTGVLQGNGASAVTTITNSSTVGQVLRTTGASTYGWGATDLADTDAVTGVLPVPNGGVGLGSVTANALIKGNGTSAMVVSGVSVDSSNNVSTTGSMTTGSAGGVTGDIALSGATSGTGHITVAAIAGTQTVTLGTSGTITIPSATDTLVGKATTDILTNKTLSVEGTGNVITTLAPIWLTAAGCSNATAGTMWDLPVTTPAVAVCVTGTNIQKGALEFADSGPFIAQNTFALPSDWTSTGGIDATIYWTTTATSGDIKWNISTAFTAVGGTAADDTAFNSAQVITTTTAGTTNFVNTSTQTALTLTGSTTATAMMFHVKVMRDGTAGGDTIAATARLIGVEIRYRRAQ